jgi:Bacteriophage lambda head decoration protein D
MAFQTQGLVAGDVFAKLLPNDQSVKTATLLAGTNFTLAGSVLGKVTASDKYKFYTPGASDGSEVAVALLLFPVDATAADTKAAIVHWTAEARRQKLAYGPAVTTAGHRTTAENQLLDRGIVVVNEG